MTQYCELVLLYATCNVAYLISAMSKQVVKNSDMEEGRLAKKKSKEKYAPLGTETPASAPGSVNRGGEKGGQHQGWTEGAGWQ